jgi:hypothetical protein
MKIKNTPIQILDSGDRTEFETGAVRDMQEGKGRCDLLPLDVVSELFDEKRNIFKRISQFQESSDVIYLRVVIDYFNEQRGWNMHTMLLEVAKHFEEGAFKYGENNWQKGLPVRSFINSAIRHYLKWLRGDQDEPHDRAFCWNILCAMWTCKNKPELNDYRTDKGGAE